jgi:hypothetical protein
VARLSLKSPRFLSNRWGPPHGVEPDALATMLLEPILDELSTAGKSWRDWATEAGAAPGDEESLAEPILSGLNDIGSALSPDIFTNALRLIATLWSRWSNGDDTVRRTLALYAGREGRSLAGILHTLNEQASNTVAQALLRAIRRHVISDHLVIAGRKLAASGTFTYHFTMSDGVISDGRLSVYSYTNPRLRNLARFLRDADLYDGVRVTLAGKRFLDESQPV